MINRVVHIQFDVAVHNIQCGVVGSEPMESSGL